MWPSKRCITSSSPPTPLPLPADSLSSLKMSEGQRWSVARLSPINAAAHLDSLNLTPTFPPPVSCPKYSPLIGDAWANQTNQAAARLKPALSQALRDNEKASLSQANLQARPDLLASSAVLWVAQNHSQYAAGTAGALLAHIGRTSASPPLAANPTGSTGQ
ncbi:hypothetical protein JCM11251_006401 [Rhodosporidiobolus azoricus]